ncbi:unnamed protein product [Nesidiocoris tenuis]|uniref:Uncharacterized protein n=1 Tax=Nesidiocoris tenuis TaxID=355587 RepID=A0A6H5H6Y8_9HEMI|nr:unnamed protein product [Nesidiocoris tenuis]
MQCTHVAQKTLSTGIFGASNFEPKSKNKIEGYSERTTSMAPPKLFTPAEIKERRRFRKKARREKNQKRPSLTILLFINVPVVLLLKLSYFIPMMSLISTECLNYEPFFAETPPPSSASPRSDRAAENSRPLRASAVLEFRVKSNRARVDLPARRGPFSLCNGLSFFSDGPRRHLSAIGAATCRAVCANLKFLRKKC